MQKCIHKGRALAYLSIESATKGIKSPAVRVTVTKCVPISSTSSARLHALAVEITVLRRIDKGLACRWRRSLGAGEM